MTQRDGTQVRFHPDQISSKVKVAYVRDGGSLGGRVEWGAEWDAGWRGDSSWQEDAGWRGDSSWQEWRGWWWYRHASGDWVEWQNPWRVQAHMPA